MRFGKIDLFAIEVEVYSFTENGRPLGRICLWIDGEQLGDYDEVEHLGVAQGTLADVIYLTGCRMDECLTGKSAGEIIQLLKEQLYGAHWMEHTIEEIREAAARFNKFRLSPGLGMAFDSLFIVLVDVDDMLQIVWSPFADVSQYREMILPRDAALGPMEQFCEWYERQTTLQ